MEKGEKKSAVELKVSLGKFFGIRLFEKLASALPGKRNPELLAKARDWVLPMRFGRSVASCSAVFSRCSLELISEPQNFGSLGKT